MLDERLDLQTLLILYLPQLTKRCSNKKYYARSKTTQRRHNIEMCNTKKTQ